MYEGREKKTEERREKKILKVTMNSALVVFLAFAVVILSAGVNGEEFCARLFNASTEVGWFAVNIDGTGRAAYAYHLDVTEVTFPATCFESKTVADGFNYHLHTLFDAGTVSPSQCGTTGGHYDPALACGPRSQNIATLCPSISRDAASGYTYGCNPTVFANGDYNLCEVGDLSGKFGKALPLSANSNVFDSDVLLDPYAPLISDYNSNSIVTLGWKSVNFHCLDTAGSRFLCGQFLPRDSSSPCPSISTSSASAPFFALCSFIMMTLCCLLF